MGEYIFYRKKPVAARVKREEKCDQILSFLHPNDLCFSWKIAVFRVPKRILAVWHGFGIF